MPIQRPDLARYTMYKLSVLCAAGVFVLLQAPWKAATKEDDFSYAPAQEFGDGFSEAAMLKLETPQPNAALSEGPNDFAGTASPGSRVVILGDGGELARTDASADGHWFAKVNVQAPMPAKVSIKALDRTTARVKASLPAIKVRSTLASGKGERPFQISRPVHNGVIEKGDWRIVGTGKVGETVSVFLDAYLLGQAKVGPDGTWLVRRRILEKGELRLLRGTQTGSNHDINHNLQVID